jgi:hypothetical protein
MMQAIAIARLMDTYAETHGAYPSGSSSTEIFQKLIDENHLAPSGKTFAVISEDLNMHQPVSDPALFWLDLPGTKYPVSSMLRPENVGFDVTDRVGKAAPDKLPLIFITGYRVTYAPHGTAVPISPSTPRWMAVCYHDLSAYAVTGEFPSPSGWPFQPCFLPGRTVVDFIDPTFDPAGKEYRQLTPDGPIAP